MSLDFTRPSQSSFIAPSSFVNGGYGGFILSDYLLDDPASEGGFGGGASGGWGGAGGAGGYSGGGSDSNAGYSGGGGSFIAEDGELLFAESGVNEDHGRVVITYVGLPNWISASTDTSTVSPGSSEQFPLNINATGVAAGEHLSNVIIHSNGSLNTPSEIPVLLTVTGTPEMSLPVTDVVFDALFIGLSDTVDFAIQNTGSDSLIVDLSSDNKVCNSC